MANLTPESASAAQQAAQFSFDDTNSYYVSLDNVQVEVTQSYNAASTSPTASFNIQPNIPVSQLAFHPFSTTNPNSNILNTSTTEGALIAEQLDFSLVNGSLGISDAGLIEFAVKIKADYPSVDGETFEFIPTQAAYEYSGHTSDNFTPESILSSTIQVQAAANFHPSSIKCIRRSSTDDTIIGMMVAVSHDAFDIQCQGTQDNVQVVVNPHQYD